MVRMTVEEINLVKGMDAQGHMEMVQELTRFLHHYGTGFAELVESTIRKLEQMGEDEFMELMEYPAEIYDEEDKADGR